MPQHFQVLRCYRCLVFQVHQLKKSNKFECKLCGEKQSIKRHYGLGTGKECRLHVQKLNGIRGEIDELNKSYTENSSDDNEFGNVLNEVQNNNTLDNESIKRGNKWSEYIEEPTEVNSNEPMYFNNSEVVLEIPKNVTKKRKRVNNISYSSTLRKSFDKTDEIENYRDLKPFEKPQNLYFDRATSKIDNAEYINNDVNKKSKPSTKFLNPKIKESKWDQYTENDEDILPSLEITSNLDEKYFQKSKNINNDINITKQCKNSPYPSTSSFECNIKSESNDDILIKNVSDVAMNSKWAQYVEENIENFENFNSTPPESSQNKQYQGLFSLCNDSDLDNILDI
ncbi:probable serine/threonine-protein kinase clkA [Galleria mellonella]|uniref:Probable serine/threonine-protein kinase clkA n=1 Tax=Galleria mellonella TaxID=7137 RepID=A0A6J1X528_GALME|nr:probable serine/threonine-protein kinase clkA [Galleria mellonella]